MGTAQNSVDSNVIRELYRSYCDNSFYAGMFDDNHDERPNLSGKRPRKRGEGRIERAKRIMRAIENGADEIITFEAFSFNDPLISFIGEAKVKVDLLCFSENNKVIKRIPIFDCSLPSQTDQKRLNQNVLRVELSEELKEQSWDAYLVSTAVVQCVPAVHGSRKRCSLATGGAQSKESITRVRTRKNRLVKMESEGIIETRKYHGVRLFMTREKRGQLEMKLGNSSIGMEWIPSPETHFLADSRERGSIGAHRDQLFSDVLQAAKFARQMKARQLVGPVAGVNIEISDEHSEHWDEVVCQMMRWTESRKDRGQSVRFITMDSGASPNVCPSDSSESASSSAPSGALTRNRKRSMQDTSFSVRPPSPPSLPTRSSASSKSPLSLDSLRSFFCPFHLSQHRSAPALLHHLNQQHGRHFHFELLDDLTIGVSLPLPSTVSVDEKRMRMEAGVDMEHEGDNIAIGVHEEDDAPDYVPLITFTREETNTLFIKQHTLPVVLTRKYPVPPYLSEISEGYYQSREIPEWRQDKKFLSYRICTPEERRFSSLFRDTVETALADAYANRPSEEDLEHVVGEQDEDRLPQPAESKKIEEAISAFVSSQLCLPDLLGPSPRGHLLLSLARWTRENRVPRHLAVSLLEEMF